MLCSSTQWGNCGLSVCVDFESNASPVPLISKGKTAVNSKGKAAVNCKGEAAVNSKG